MRRAWLLLAIAACSGGRADGPAEVKWDRDTCGQCTMVLSDRAFAAQVQGGPRRETYKFDDLGCALQWLEKQPWRAEPATRIWVARFPDGAWIDARAARFVGGKASPMGGGFGALDPGSEGLTFDEAKQQILTRKAAHPGGEMP